MVDRCYDAGNEPDVRVRRRRRRWSGCSRATAIGPGAPQVAAAARRPCAPAATRPREIVTGGGSDANALEAAGFPCTNLANGTERNHEPTERVAVAALEGMLDVTFALLDALAAP